MPGVVWVVLRHALCLGLPIELIGQVGPQAFSKQLADRADRGRGARAFGCEGMGRLLWPVRDDDLVHKARGQGLFRADTFAEQADLRGAREPDRTW